jgi:hypothetical protein
MIGFVIKQTRCGGRCFLGNGIFEQKWVHRTLAAHAASLDVLPTNFCA